MHDGSRFIAKFKESKSGKLFFTDHDYVNKSDVRSTNVYKNETTKPLPKVERAFDLPRRD
jgi:hypothetical protein